MKRGIVRTGAKHVDAECEDEEDPSAHCDFHDDGGVSNGRLCESPRRPNTINYHSFVSPGVCSLKQLEYRIIRAYIRTQENDGYHDHPQIGVPYDVGPVHLST